MLERNKRYREIEFQHDKKNQGENESEQ